MFLSDNKNLEKLKGGKTKNKKTKMRAVCTICADTLKDNFSAAPCGHAFHSTCLEQWLDHQKNCPQCRKKCTKKQIIKLFLDSDGIGDTSLLLSDNDISKDELKERMKEQHEMFKEKDESLKKTLQELTLVREELLAWKTQHDSVAYKLQQEKGSAESLKQQMKILQKDREYLERKADEAMELRRELTKLVKIDHLLKSPKTDSHTQEMLERASHQMLKDYAKTLKLEYELLKEKRSSLQDEKKRNMQQISSYKKKLQDAENELHNLREKVSLMESDLHTAESDKESLTKKIQMLEQAIESPNSRVLLRRLLESPLPDRLDFKRPKLDLSSSSLNGSFISPSDCIKTQENKPPVQPKAKGSVREEISVPVLVTNSTLNSSTSCLRTGFNGLGGHTNYLKPKLKPFVSNGGVKKQCKFAPRFSSSKVLSKNNGSTMKQSTFSSLKFKS